MNPTNSIPPSSPFTQGAGITPVYGATDSSEHRSNTYVLAMYDGFFLGGQSAKTWVENRWTLTNTKLIPSNSTGDTLPGL